jgi:beta-ring hydroxylase
VQVLLTKTQYSKGILSEILDFVMGTGLIPADGEIWKKTRPVCVSRLALFWIFFFNGCPR